MKNFTNILHRGNLTPRERYLLLIQNDIHKTKTGKEILTPADKDALENWRAKDSTESREWNRLNEGWQHSGRMDIEAEFLYKDAQVAYLAQLPLIMEMLSYPSDERMAGSIKTLKQIKKVSVEKAVEIAVKQKTVKLREGLDFDYAVYQFAFERLSSDDKERMNELYPDIETDHQYLDQEEIIANLYNNDKGELTGEAKDKLATLVAERSYNKFAKEYQLYHYFACIPLVEVAKYFLKSKGIEIKGKPMAKNQESDDEDDNTFEAVTEAMTAYAKEHKITIEEMLKQGCLRGLDEGLLEEYRPLIISNEEDLFNRWLQGRVLAKKKLLGHIEAGELRLRDRTKEETRKDMLYSKRLYDGELELARRVMGNIGLEAAFKGELDEKGAFETFDGKVIMGESLYDFKENYIFVKNFRELVDRYDPNLGIVYADDDPEHKGEHLDQELLICDTNDKGEAHFFSRYGMAVTLLSNIIKGKTFFKESGEEGKTYLEFKNSAHEHAFRTRRQDLINGYAQLMAFEKVFIKLATIYEADMAHHVSGRLTAVKGFIEGNNEAIRIATNTQEDDTTRTGHGLFSRKDILHFKEDLIIDITKIEPDEKAVEEHRTKLRGIFGDF